MIKLDNEDWEKYRGSKWFQATNGEVLCLKPILTLAHLILGVEPEKEIKFVDGDDRNLTKENLRSY